MKRQPNPEKNNHFPNLGKLSIAILEHVNESFLGEKAVEELKAPLIQKELRDSLEKALENTEKRFRRDCEDEEIREIVISLPLADLPSIKRALQSFYNRPVDSTLPQLLRERLTADFPKLSNKRIDTVVSTYIKILREELIPVSADIREKLSALATLDTEVNTAQIVKLVERLIEMLTIEQSSDIQKHRTEPSSISSATNQGAQAGSINFNVNLPNQLESANPSEFSVQNKDDDSRSTSISWDARDLLLLQRYFRSGRNHNPKLFKKDLVDLDETKVQNHLVANGLAKLAHDRHLYLTQAGVLLCCKQDRFPTSIFHSHVKFKNTSHVEELTVELFGPVFYVYNELYRLLEPIFQRRLGSPDIRDAMGSEGVFFEYPEKAIVEALVNLLIHRDYFEDDLGRVTVYPDKIEFINPGQSKYPPKVLLDATSPIHPKYVRNQRLIEAMNKTGLNQRDGRGILTIKNALKENGSYQSDGSLGLSIENDSINDRFLLTIYKRIPRVAKSEVSTTISSSHSSSRALRFGSAPPRPSLLIGRDDDVKALKDRLTTTTDGKTTLQVLTAIKGWPGVGKTTIASALAYDPDIAKLFTDGILWTSLGQEPNILSEMATWGRALGTDEILRAKSVAEAQNLLAGLLRNKRMLLIIDDVWKAEDAFPFKVGGVDCATLITTRLDGIANALAPVADDIYRLKVLKDEDALELLKQLAPSVVKQHPNECLVLVQELEGLPLALQVAGRLLNTEANFGFGVIELIEDLREGAKLLEATAPADRTDLVTETTPTIAALLQKSLDRLDETTKECYAYLGVFAPKPATFDVEAIKYVWQMEDPRPVIKTLVDRGLLEFVLEMDRYQMHAVLVMLARTLLTDEELSPSRVESKHLHHSKYYATVLHQVNELYVQGGEALKRGLDLFDMEWENIRIGLTWAVDHIDESDAAELYIAMVDDGNYLFDLRLQPQELIHWLETALIASRRLGRREAESRYLNRLGIVNIYMGKVRQAIEYYTQALAKVHESNYRLIEGGVLGNLGLAYAALGEVEQSIKLYEQALAIERALGDRRGESSELNNLGMSYMYLGESHRAAESYQQALVLYKEIGDIRGEANVLNNLAVVYRYLGNIHQAVEIHEQALRIFQEMGDRRGEGHTLDNLGASYIVLGEPERALDFYDRAITILREIGDRFGEGKVIWNQSLASYKLGNFTKAIASAEAALAIYEQVEAPASVDVRKQLGEWRKSV